MLEHYLVKPSNQAYQSQLQSVIKRHHVLSKLTARRIFELHIEQFNTAQMWALRNHATRTDHLNCWPVNLYCLMRRHIEGLVRLVTAQCPGSAQLLWNGSYYETALCYSIQSSFRHEVTKPYMNLCTHREKALNKHCFSKQIWPNLSCC